MVKTTHDFRVKCIMTKHTERHMFYTRVRDVLDNIYAGYTVKLNDYHYTTYRESPSCFWRMWKAFRETNLPILLDPNRKDVEGGFKDEPEMRLMTSDEFTKYHGSAAMRVAIRHQEWCDRARGDA